MHLACRRPACQGMHKQFSLLFPQKYYVRTPDAFSVVGLTNACPKLKRGPCFTSHRVKCGHSLVACQQRSRIGETRKSNERTHTQTWTICNIMYNSSAQFTLAVGREFCPRSKDTLFRCALQSTLHHRLQELLSPKDLAIIRIIRGTL